MFTTVSADKNDQVGMKKQGFDIVVVIYWQGFFAIWKFVFMHGSIPLTSAADIQISMHPFWGGLIRFLDNIKLIQIYASVLYIRIFKINLIKIFIIQ